MANGNDVVKNGKRNGLSYRQTFVVATISAVLSGSALPWLLSSIGVNPYRPAAFTSHDGKVLERRIESLEAHLTNHPDQTGQFDRRITTLEVKLDVLISNQQRILDRLNP